MTIARPASSLRGLLLLALLGPCPAAAQAQAQRQPPSAPTAASVAQALATITGEDIRRRVGVIAADSMRGRMTPSPELEETAAWIASEFRAFGLEPAGDAGGFLQRFSLRTLVLDPAGSTATVGGSELRFGRDVAPAFAYVLPNGRREGPLWVVSGTASAAWPEGLSLKGAHVLLVPPVRADVGTPAVIALIRAVLAAEPLGIWIANDRPDRDWAYAANTELRRQHVQVGDLDTLAVLSVRDQVLAPILAAAGMDLGDLRARAGAPVRWDDARRLVVSLDARVNTVSDASAPNVVGILRGSDPVLRDEFVVYSAHMDHIGVGDPVAGDSINNGADDDASGTSTVVELAQAFSSLPVRPRRSIIFLTVSGEEEGLWGSSWFTTHPPVPIERMVADLNIDMVGRNWPDTIVAIGREHSDLGATLAQVNARHPELGMTAIDDPWPAERFYQRSDHYNFARRGVPILFFFSGTHEDYHRPSDEVARIDAEKTARIGKLLFLLGLEVADRTVRPQWDPASRASIVGR